MDLILIISLLKASVAYLVSSTEPGVTIAQQQQAIEFANKATILAIQALQNSQSIQAQPANTQQITAIQQVSQTSQQTSQNIVTSQENQTVQNIQTNQSNSQTNKDTQTQSVVLGSQTPQDEQVDYGTAVLCFIEPGIEITFNRFELKDPEKFITIEPNYQLLYDKLPPLARLRRARGGRPGWIRTINRRLIRALLYR